VHGSRTHHGTLSAPSAVLKTEDITGCLALSNAQQSEHSTVYEREAHSIAPEQTHRPAALPTREAAQALLSLGGSPRNEFPRQCKQGILG
jgi:hypothetical protein